MNSRRHVKAIGGLLTLVVFLALVVADTIDAGVTLTLEDKVFLLTLIGALLGVDRLLERLPTIDIGLSGGNDDE